MKSKIFFTIFIVTWGLLVIFNFIIKSPKFSNQENRYLASMPSFSFTELVSGEYASKLNDYINDHFIARNFWLKFNSFIQISLGKKENNGVYIGKDGYLFEKVNYTEEEKDNLNKISVAVNNFEKNIDVPVYFMLIPNSIYINQDKLPNNVTTFDQNQVIEEFYKTLNKDIKKVNVTNTILNNKDKRRSIYCLFRIL